MKKLITPIIIIILFFVSCGEVAEEVTPETSSTEEESKEQIDSVKVEDVVEAETEEIVNMEGTAVEGDDRYDNMSAETTMSDCFIVSHFTDMDIMYVTVDFVSWKVTETDTEPEYELVNELNKLRTFMVDAEYFDCGHSEKMGIEKLFETAKEDKETLFNIVTENGMVTEFFVRRCAG